MPTKLEKGRFKIIEKELGQLLWEYISLRISSIHAYWYYVFLCQRCQKQRHLIHTWFQDLGTIAKIMLWNKEHLVIPYSRKAKSCSRLIHRSRSTLFFKRATSTQWNIFVGRNQQLKLKWCTATVSPVVFYWIHNNIRHSLELCQFRCTEEEISDANIKVYYQQIVFATCSIFRIKWARGPHVGQPWSTHITQKAHKVKSRPLRSLKVSNTIKPCLI